jgi:Lysozyme like domain
MVIAITLIVISASLFLIYANGTGATTIPNVATYARQAGFTGDDLVTAVAIALAESGGNARAYNPEKQSNTPDGKGSYGLWQIYLKAHPEFTNLDLYDPQTNANAAFSVYSKAGGFSPWTTYGNGAYQVQLGVATDQISA